MARVVKESNTLVSSGGTNSVYVNRKNRKKSKGDKKLKLRKYDPVLRKHVLFEEKKLSKKKVKKAAAADKTAADKTAADKTAAVKAPADKAPADKAPADKAAAAA